MANKVVSGVQNAHLGRRGIRMLGGAAMGIAAGSIGLAAGVASGDASKAVQYAGAAGLGGYKLGDAIVNKGNSALDISGTMDKAKEYYHQGDPDYKQKQIDREIKMAQKDYDLRLRAEDLLGSKEEAKKFMEEDVAEYARYGIAKEDMLAVKQLQNSGYSRNEAMSIGLANNLYSGGKDTRFLSSKTDEELNKTIRNKYTKNIKDDSEKNERVKHIRDGMDLFNKFKFDNEN